MNKALWCILVYSISFEKNVDHDKLNYFDYSPLGFQ